jgi:predicted secreted protein
MQFGENDDGVEVTIRQRHGIAIVLPENPMTGYSWAFEIDGFSIVLAGDDYAPISSLLGDGGHRTARFTAQRFGVSTICGYLRRPWETHEHAIKTYKLTVMVSA